MQIRFFCFHFLFLLFSLLFIFLFFFFYIISLLSFSVFVFFLFLPFSFLFLSLFSLFYSLSFPPFPLHPTFGLVARWRIWLTCFTAALFLSFFTGFNDAAVAVIDCNVIVVTWRVRGRFEHTRLFSVSLVQSCSFHRLKLVQLVGVKPCCR